MNETHYREKVIATFGEKTLRSAYVIDDQFPTYGDLMGGKKDDFRENAIAQSMHEFFRQRGIPCDIENLIGGSVTDDHIERIRKTDLIVLDYNLDSSDQTDNKTAIDILGKLVDTPHFNMVVVYTKTEDLDRVWGEIATSLRGGWDEPQTDRHSEIFSKWRSAVTKAPQKFPKQVLHAFICGRSKDAPKEVMSQLRSELDEISRDDENNSVVAKDELSYLVDELARREVLLLLRGHKEEEIKTSREINARCDGRIRWVQCGQCFIAVMGKPQDNNETATTPGEILEHLHDALIDWRPSLLQILVAEIQNILELEALATETKSLRDPDLQVGLAYYLLWSIPDDLNPSEPEYLRPYVSTVISKLVDGIQRRVSEDPDLNDTASNILFHELSQNKWLLSFREEREKRPRLYATAKKISNIVSGTDPSDEEMLLLKLNVFLSSEPFMKEAITTGTIFTNPESGECWVCLTPACDMVPRLPNPEQKWMNHLHPVRPIMSVRLDEHVPAGKAVKNANHGKSVFIEHGDRIRSFSLVDDKNNQPSVETMFLLDAGRTVSGVFVAERIVRPENASPHEMKAIHLEVIGQVRENYASRFLNMVGNHVSRIGVDFVATEKQ